MEKKTRKQNRHISFRLRTHPHSKKNKTLSAGYTTKKHRKINTTTDSGDNVNKPIPAIIETLINSYIKKKTGKDYWDPVVLERIRHSISAQKASYWKDNPGTRVKYNRAYDIFSYLSYHLPVYFTQFNTILELLSQDNLLPESARILDIGTGPGVVPLAIMNYWREKKKGKLEIYALEQSQEHIEAFNYLTSAYRDSDPLITIHPVIQENLMKINPITHPDFPNNLTIITFQNVVAELEYGDLSSLAQKILSYASLLEEMGILIIIEPAEMRHATNLRRLQIELMNKGLFVYAPCAYPWSTRCNPSDCWTFREEKPIRPTEMMNLLAGEKDRFRFYNTDIKFSYLIMLKNKFPVVKYLLPKKYRLIQLSHIKRYYRRLISVIGAKMSSDIGGRGIHIFKICDGTCHESVYIILSDRNRRPAHTALFSSSYGDILLFSKVLVRKHEKYNSWNLIVGKDSSIEVVHRERH